jgi:hypothetical protein
LQLSLLATGVLLVACGKTRLNVGSNDAGTGARSRDAGTTEVGELYQGTPSNSFGFDCTMPAPARVAGTWIGQFDKFKLPSGSNALRIDVKGYSPQLNGVCGTVVLGEGDPLPPTTDPSEFPPGMPSDPEHDAPSTPREGFPYEMASSGPIQVDAGTRAPNPTTNEIQFFIYPNQIFNAWCEMQRSYEETMYENEGRTISTSYSCYPTSVLVPPMHGGMACDAGVVKGITLKGLSCAQARLCELNFCTCGGAKNGALFADPRAKGCSIATSGAERSANFTADGETMTGEIEILPNFEFAHLTRQPAPPQSPADGG